MCVYVSARNWAEICSQLKKPNTFVLCVDWITVFDCHFERQSGCVK